MSEFNDYYQAMDEIESFLRKELIGPLNEKEVLTEQPLGVYTIGILWPQQTSIEEIKVQEGIDEETILEALPCQTAEMFEPDTEIIDELDDGLAVSMEQIRNTSTFRPSALGLTMVVPGDMNRLVAQFKCGMYRHSQAEESYEKIVKLEDGRTQSVTKTRIANYYSRYALDTGEIVFELVEGSKKGVVLEAHRIPDNIAIDLFVRKIYPDGKRLVTISVLNKTKAFNADVLQNTAAIFQCQLAVSCPEGFLPIEEQLSGKPDVETEILELLYREHKSYAVGHGCSVKWEMEQGKVYKIKSEFMPVAELLPLESREFPNLKCLKMGYWQKDIREQGCKELELFVDYYEDWFKQQKKKAFKTDNFVRGLESNFANIELCIKRLRDGIRCLRNNDLAWQSFVYMNEAMLLQRVNYSKAKKKKIAASSVTWYPFQLAYILQVIPDIVEKEREWRKTVDLLWFPTGGGKTEAYLGLIAFVIFYRRLTNGNEGSGVAVIMRYTLRLLTVQQFERATALICGCEFLRRKYGLSGGEISIGLWVGMAMTPNRLEQAKDNLARLMEGETVYQGNPVQVQFCPFCGAELGLGNYKISDRMTISCSSEECVFKEGLPIYVVDDDIYQQRPTLILSTIDKFARIVWEERTVAIFGSDGATLPPELIIQDELHLISGPLGSLSGLYEMAIDELCTREGISPKVIAATATTRNAVSQVKNLYNRNCIQFPPYAMDLDDCFYAIRGDKEHRPARRYLGICVNGGSLLDLMIRVYGCLFFTLNYLEAKGFREDVIDQYYTIVGYFNALKNLGSSATVIADRVWHYSEYLRLHKFKDWADDAGLNKIVIRAQNELTSRKSAKEIKDVLNRLDISYPDERAYSYILASNMLSVGIDINRLGLMTVYNQPKTTGEYIQATSRVGRHKPGLVLTLFNGMRTRDKSHYEQFTYYHQTFYKNVEATSSTPFAFRAMEKALHGAYVALVRHQVPELRSDGAANRYRRKMAAIQEIKNKMLARVADINQDALENARDYLDDFEEVWERDAINKAENFYYTLKNRSADTIYTLLIEAEKENLTDLPSTLNSLRNVDAMSNVYLLSRDDMEG